MTAAGGWFSASELAKAKLPGLSASKRKINERALAERWAYRTGADGAPLARLRQGKGGGTEYHVSLLPPATRIELAKRKLIAVEADVAENVTKLPATGSAQLWDWYERQSSKVKAEAEERAAAIDAVERLGREGMPRSAAVATVAAQTGTAGSTLYQWLALVAHCACHDRLPNLAPRYRGGGREAGIDPELWKLYEGNFLRFEQPTHAASYELVRRVAVERGISIPHAKTFQRKLERETPPAVIVARREGRDAVARLVPPQIRSTDHMAAMEMVNIDGHRWDVFVRFEDGTVARPLMVAIQDIRSRKVLAWRIDINETAFIARLVFADLFRDFGIPKSCLLDNGRAFASKLLTGQAKTRYRFRIKADDPCGLLPALGIENRWATPYHGQAKPIERAFRDMCGHIAKHPAFQGAYTGNSPTAKPEDYGSRAIPFDLFKQIVDSEIAAHNARPGRRGQGLLAGESFDQAFRRTLGPVGVATKEHMRLALLAGEQRIADRDSGALTIHGNRYWCDGMAQFAGQKLTVRFDPENLHTDGRGGLAEVYAYDTSGRLVATVPLWEAVGFDNADAAQKRAKLMGDHRKAVKRAVQLADIMDAQDIAARLPGSPEPEPLRPQVIRPVRHRGNTALAVEADESAANPINFMDRFGAGLAATTPLRLVE